MLSGIYFQKEEVNMSTEKLSSRRRTENIMAWIFSTPAILFLILFLIVPFMMAFGCHSLINGWFPIPACLLASSRCGIFAFIQ